jgi:pimeloyl-ACP methyl ester carboxylesterase
MPKPTESIVTCGDSDLMVLRGGSGDPLFVLHDELGWPGWTSWCEELSAQRELIVPLQPGFGDSPRIRWIRSYRDLALFYARVIRELGLGPVDVIGFSAGGYTAAELAVCSPSLIRTLTLVAPMGVKPRDGIITDFLAMPVGLHLAHTMAISDAPDAAEIYGGAMTPEQFERFEDARAETARLGWEPFMFDPTLPHHLGGVGQMPVQLIWGAEDEIVPEDCINAYRDALPSATVEIIRRSGHRPEVELPDEFVSLVTRFLGAERSIPAMG